MISKECLTEKFKQIKKDYPNINMNIFIPYKSSIINFMNLFYKRFENINNFMDWIGLSLIDRIKLKNKLAKEYSY